MNWKEIYEKRVVTAEAALSQIKNGDMIMPSHAAAEPKYLFNKLVEMKGSVSKCRHFARVKYWRCSIRSRRV